MRSPLTATFAAMTVLSLGACQQPTAEPPAAAGATQTAEVLKQAAAADENATDTATISYAADDGTTVAAVETSAGYRIVDGIVPTIFEQGRRSHI